jgi:hypothetical protein
MATPNYGGLAASLAARPRKPPMGGGMAQIPRANDVYQQTPRGTVPPAMGAMSKPMMGGGYGNQTQQGFGGGGFGSGVAGFNAFRPISQAQPTPLGPPTPGMGPQMGYQDMLGSLLGGGGMSGAKPDMGGGSYQLPDPIGMTVPGFGAPQKPDNFGGTMTGAKPMPIPGGGGMGIQTPLEDYVRKPGMPPMGRRFP